MSTRANAEKYGSRRGSGGTGFGGLMQYALGLGPDPEARIRRLLEMEDEFKTASEARANAAAADRQRQATDEQIRFGKSEREAKTAEETKKFGETSTGIGQALGSLPTEDLQRYIPAGTTFESPEEQARFVASRQQLLAGLPVMSGNQQQDIQNRNLIDLYGSSEGRTIQRAVEANKGNVNVGPGQAVFGPLDTFTGSGSKVLRKYEKTIDPTTNMEKIVPVDVMETIPAQRTTNVSEEEMAKFKGVPSAGGGSQYYQGYPGDSPFPARPAAPSVPQASAERATGPAQNSSAGSMSRIAESMLTGGISGMGTEIGKQIQQNYQEANRTGNMGRWGSPETPKVSGPNFWDLIWGGPEKYVGDILGQSIQKSIPKAKPAASPDNPIPRATGEQMGPPAPSQWSPDGTKWIPQKPLDPATLPSIVPPTSQLNPLEYLPQTGAGNFAPVSTTWTEQLPQMTSALTGLQDGQYPTELPAPGTVPPWQPQRRVAPTFELPEPANDYLRMLMSEVAKAMYPQKERELQDEWAANKALVEQQRMAPYNELMARSKQEYDTKYPPFGPKR
jgi:hypothetical protein